MEKLALISAEWDVVDLIESFSNLNFLGIIDSASPEACYDVAYLGNDDHWPQLKQIHPDIKVVIAVDAPFVKARLVNHYGQDAIYTIQSKEAYVSSRAQIGMGTIIQREVTIMPKAKIGAFSKINVRACIHHEASIGNSCTIAPGAQLLGKVTLEDFVYVGAGAIIKQKCRIGKGAIIGAGAVVIRDVAPHTTVVGVPAKELCKDGK